MSAVIETRHLGKWYGEVVGVNDVTVTLGSGITGFLGPNGAGKSTLLWLLTGQLRPSQGEVSVYGESPWQNAALFRRVGFCPETEGLYRSLTGREFVMLLARLSGLGRQQARTRADETLEVLGMTEFKNRRIGTYSKGMRQRVKFAQSLVHDPELLILDEPLAGLDPIGRRDMLALIRRLGDAGKDVILASHILHEVESVTSRILLINRGRILAEGDVHEIRALIDRHPHHVKVACDRPRELAKRLIGSNDVISVRIDPDASALSVETARPDAFYSHLMGVLAGSDLDVTAIESPDDNLAAVFEYLME